MLSGLKSLKKGAASALGLSKKKETTPAKTEAESAIDAKSSSDVNKKEDTDTSPPTDVHAKAGDEGILDAEQTTSQPEVQDKSPAADG